MTHKSHYTTEEWQLLLDVPPLVGTAVMVAGKSGLGTMKEAYALASSVLAGKKGYEGNELITALVDGRMQRGERSQVEGISDNPYRGLSPEALLDVVLEKCDEVQTLLADKSEARERGEFFRWSVEVGEQVAQAAKEGGFLGVGGERVSDEERRVLTAVRERLGLPESREIG